MYQDKIVLCAASAYNKKYYLNPDFDGLPDPVKKELQIMCVLFTEDIGGIIELYFDENGSLHLMTDSEEGDLTYDNIGAPLKIKQIQKDQRQLFTELEEYFRELFQGKYVISSRCRKYKYHARRIPRKRAHRQFQTEYRDCPYF